jgi:3-hydroxyisobutyrate dehydrogenase-like beta-hydroxyacid dehydrogenase
VAPTGARYVDVAVMGPVAPYGHKVPLLVGGPGAKEFLPRARALGMSAEYVSEEVGQPSAIKMFRSIMVKGLEALMVECMLASSSYGVEDRVLGSLAETFPGLEPLMAEATAARQQWVADLGVRRTRGAKNEDRAALVAALRAALGAPG